MLIIGSVAMMQWVDLGMYRRHFLDIDAIVWPEELEEFDNKEEFTLFKEKPNKRVYRTYKEDTGQHMYYEFEVANPGTNQEFLLKQLGIPATEVEIASPELLYTLKMSHRYLKNSPHFMKTMMDIRALRQEFDLYEIPEEFKDWYHWRVENTYNYSHPKLNQSKQEFFDTSVFANGFTYTYDHDSIHQAVAIHDKPAYTYFTDDEVRVSRAMFEALPEAIKLASVYEESAVLALERAIIPSRTPEDVAFKIALEKVCTSIASGWWREYAWENYRQVVLMYIDRKDTVNSITNRFEEGIINGVIKPFEES